MSATVKSIQKIRLVLRSQLNNRNKILAINTSLCTALLVIRYPAGIIIWPQEDTDASDFET